MSPKELAKAREISYRWSPLKYYHLSPHAPQPGKSAEALPAALGDLLGGVDGVGNKSTLDALPAILDLDVPAPHQLKDVLRQLHKCLTEQKQKSTHRRIIDRFKMARRHKNVTLAKGTFHSAS